MKANVEFMRTLEGEWRRASGLANRSSYKIFYGQVFPAPILTLGLNPAGSPEGTSEDGLCQEDGSPASSSVSFFEGMENDILDCHWRENTGLRKLLLPLVGNDPRRFRGEVVKTNIAFRRSVAVSDIDLDAATSEAVPFLERIVARAAPKVIVLTCRSMDRFLGLYASSWRPLAETVRTSRNLVVFAAAAAKLRCLERETVVVEVAHASRFAWTYDEYGVPEKIGALLHSRHTRAEQVPHSPSATPTPTHQAASSIERRGSQATSAPWRRNPDLAELEAGWNALGLADRFHSVHHFSDPRFRLKRETLRGFLDYCEGKELGRENAQTVQRALDLARRVEGGQDFHTALAGAWAAFDIVTR